MTKTRYTMREWITLLEPDVQQKLIGNMRRQDKLHRLDKHFGSLHDTLTGSMSWRASQEGANYWYQLTRKTNGDTRKPGRDIDCTVPI